MDPKLLFLMFKNCMFGLMYIRLLFQHGMINYYHFFLTRGYPMYCQEPYMALDCGWPAIICTEAPNPFVCVCFFCWFCWSCCGVISLIICVRCSPDTFFCLKLEKESGVLFQIFQTLSSAKRKNTSSTPLST